MKRVFLGSVCLGIVMLGGATTAAAQQSPPQHSPAQQVPTQPVRIEMVCRDMATTGDFLAPNETMLGNKACHPVSVQRMGDSAAANAAAQPASGGEAAVPPPTPAFAPTPENAYATHQLPPANIVDNSIRVYVTDNTTWNAKGGWSGTATAPAPKTGPAAAGPPAAGAVTEDPKDVEFAAANVDKLVTEVNHQCPQVVITSVLARAEFAVTLDHDGKAKSAERNKVVVFNHGGDDIFSAASKGVVDSIGDACTAIVKAAKR
jgi:hypothetical protein